MIGRNDRRVDKLFSGQLLTGPMRGREAPLRSLSLVPSLVVTFYLPLFVVLQCVQVGGVTVIASTSLETCTTSGQYDEGQDTVCTEKVVAVVALDGGTLASTAKLEFNVSCVGADAGRCPCQCNYVTQPSCDCRDLTTTAVVRVERSPVQASFPLTYLRTFNAKPYEARSPHPLMFQALRVCVEDAI